MLISIFFVLPDSVMLYLFITAINDNIQFARMEQRGNEYQRPLEDLLERLPQHRQFAEGRRDEMKREAAEIDAAFMRLEEIDARIGSALQFTAEGLAQRHREHCCVKAVRDEWEQLKAQLPRMTPLEIAERHQHLIADVRTMITHAGDTSNLILDPDLDSYYLMDATLLALPQAQERVADVMERAETVLSQPVVGGRERQQFAVFATLLEQQNRDRVTSSVETSLREDANFYGINASLQAKLPPALRDYVAALDAFIGMTKAFAGADGAQASREEYLAAGREARDASFTLWRIAADEMDRLLERRIAAYGERRARSLLVAAGALLAAIGFVTFITRSISGPLRQQALELSGANEALQAEIAERKRSEEELRKIHAQLLEVSRYAGMAEVATGVLHNVGNVLNSVNVSALLITERLTKSRVAHLAQVAAAFRDHASNLGEFIANDPKGRRLPGFIESLAERLGNEQTDLLREAEGLSKNISHIKDIVATQQEYAKVSGVVETLPAASLVEDALDMNGAAFHRHRVQVVREFDEVPPVRVEKHKVLQILINMIRNAKYAVSESRRHDKQITVSIARNGSDRVKISVADNGIGIARENLSRIFAHGFTTKVTGHGFGLHTCAIAAKELGGSLIAQSPGLDQGATFTLELPMEATSTH